VPFLICLGNKPPSDQIKSHGVAHLVQPLPQELLQ